MALNLGYVALIGLGTYKLTEFYKEALQRVGLYQAAWWKSLVSVFFAVLLALFVQHRDLADKVLIVVAAAGLGAVIHALDTLLRHHRDKVATEVLEKGRRQRRV